MSVSCELANRSSMRILQCDGTILICAEGDLPSPGFEIKIEQSPLRIFPPQFNIVRCRQPGVFPQVITPYRICKSFPLGDKVPEITVNHAEGSDKVAIEPCGKDHYGYEESCRYSDDDQGGVPATGRSASLSFDQAFADALAQLPPSPVSDGQTRVRVTEIGGLFGGIAGFHELFVKIRADIDGIS
ncbi:MAG: hypothetical protein ACR2RF_01295 [Geminicoccaceae bacterium]